MPLVHPRADLIEETPTAQLRWNQTTGALQQLWTITHYTPDRFLEEMVHETNKSEEWRDVPWVTP